MAITNNTNMFTIIMLQLPMVMTNNTKHRTISYIIISWDDDLNIIAIQNCKRGDSLLCHQPKCKYFILILYDYHGGDKNLNFIQLIAIFSFGVRSREYRYSTINREICYFLVSGVCIISVLQQPLHRYSYMNARYYCFLG
jgi:hypothetical protein